MKLYEMLKVSNSIGTLGSIFRQKNEGETQQKDNNQYKDHRSVEPYHYFDTGMPTLESWAPIPLGLADRPELIPNIEDTPDKYEELPEGHDVVNEHDNRVSTEY